MNYSPSPQDTLLVVDDVPANVSVLLEFLTNAGFKVLVAKDGSTAIKRVAYGHPDLILLDVMMPGKSGFEVCEILKSQAESQDIPIIFMTAVSDTVDKVKGLSLGAVDYITKPFQQEEMLARIKTHLNLRKLQQKLEKRNMELKAFARTVAHDLKNPINGIIGLCNLLLKQRVSDSLKSENQEKYLQWIAESGQKTIEIIDALLLLAGASQQDYVETRPLDMLPMINHVLETRLAQMVKDFQGEIRLAEIWPVALGYAPWVEEIWVNYLSNGLKYGGQPPHLELGANTQDDGIIRFWVRDNGPGMTKKAQAQLFTPFIRLHQDRADGHGLGLSIVRQIVEKLGGQAGVESAEGRGSVFYFTLLAHDFKK